MLITLDPSSSCIGWAIFPGDGGDPVDFGKLTGKGDDAVKRIVRLADDLSDLLLGREGGIVARIVDRVVVEIPDGKVAGNQRGPGRSNGAGLSVYGMGVGYYLAVLNERWAHASEANQIHVVTQTQWTNRKCAGRRVTVQSKEQRQAWVAMCHGKNGYDPATDPGGDVADAIALGMWWFTERKLAAAGA